MQPGQPVDATWELDNPHGAQTLQFILRVSGDAPISDVTLEIDGVSETLIPVTLETGQILKYSGGDRAILYDKHWNELKNVELDASELQIGPGVCEICLGCRFHTADEPEVKLEFRTVGQAETCVVQTDAR